MVLLLPTIAWAVPPVPCQGCAPLLFARFSAPPGLNVTFFQGCPQPREFDVPVTVGLRPGYIYRVKLTGIPGRPELVLFPSVEVRGTLSLPKIIRASDHPAPVVFTNDDFDRVMRGALITKVIFLEDPEQALATATRPDQPLELEVPAGLDPLTESRSHGRPLLVIRLGERDYREEELARQAIPGTLSLPGDKYLPPPALKPCIPWACVPIIDPILGPKPCEEECLHDGGDCGERVGLDRNGAVHGLDPSDTVSAYSDSRGRRRLAISNRVCLCVPRFVVLRGVLALLDHQSVVGVGEAEAVQAQIKVEARMPSLVAQQQEQLAALRGRQRSSGTIASLNLERLDAVALLKAVHIDIGVAEALGTSRLEQLTMEQRTRLVRQIEFARQFIQPYGVRGVEQVSQGPVVVGRLQGVNVVSNVQEVRDLNSSCEEPPRLPDQPLHLYKWASTRSAQVGDVVTFFLKYANHGGQPISDVAVSDSLTGRLEYVTGSSRSNRDAVFTTLENRAGSLLLHWEVSGPLQPGQSGVVSFQARIR